MAKAKVAKDIGRNQRVKLKRKINLAARKGKLKKHQRDQIAKIQEKKTATSRKKFREVQDDYEHERAYKKEQDGKISDDEDEKPMDVDISKNAAILVDSEDEQEDPLPLDMLDDDIDWENSAFFSKKRKELDDEEEDKVRRFKTDLAEDEQEMLPIKLSDGRVVKRVSKIKIEEEDEPEDIKPDIVKQEDDYSRLSAPQLLIKRKELMQETREDIARMCIAITADPEHNVCFL
uniref:Uncharacterized protein n=1 Tax=Panagrolaimus superbus TaxID=310955 RepID=A0A914Z642_9BILA